MGERRVKDFSMPLSDLGKPDEDFSGGEGIVKWTVQEPAGGKKHHFSFHGRHAEVHFTGKLLDGTVFASSRENGIPLLIRRLNFQEDVMKGFHLAIRSMQPGEKSIFTVPVALALSASGSPASIPWNIPPDQTLRFDIELISFTNHIFRDQGILKKTVKLGEEMCKPPMGFDHVFVNYNVRLKDGTSVSKSEEVEFSVREGFFCPAFAHAVKTMEIGEEAILIVKPEYGFGEQGRPAKGNEAAVPPDATLYVNLKLMLSVSLVGVNRDIIKKFITVPSRFKRPYNEAVVKVRLIGKLQDGTVFDRRGHDKEEPLKFTIDEEHVIYGLDEAVMTMREGEVASFTIPPQHAFGVAGSNQYHLAIVPPNSVVIYEMELLSVVEDELEHEYRWPQNITSEEFIEAAKIKEREGDDLFGSGKYLRAYRRYLRARQILPPCFKFSLGEEELPDCHQIKEMLISITLKSAECAILLQYYEEASKRYHEVLKYDPENAKALEMVAQPLPKSPVEVDSDAMNRGLEFYEAVLYRAVPCSASRELPYRPPASGRPIIVPGLPKASQQPPVSTPRALPQPQSPANQSSLAQRIASLLLCSCSGFSSPRHNSSHGPGP